jgi:hypothetical protein
MTRLRRSGEQTSFSRDRSGDLQAAGAPGAWPLSLTGHGPCMKSTCTECRRLRPPEGRLRDAPCSPAPAVCGSSAVAPDSRLTPGRRCFSHARPGQVIGRDAKDRRIPEMCFFAQYHAVPPQEARFTSSTSWWLGLARTLAAAADQYESARPIRYSEGCHRADHDRRAWRALPHSICVQALPVRQPCGCMSAPTAQERLPFS